MTASATSRAFFPPALAALALLSAAPAHAVSRIWVSSSGLDSASCGAVTSPCRTFQQAHDNIPAGGDIGVLTPGDYAPIKINKAVNITNDGTGEAAVLAPSGPSTITSAVSIFAGAGDIVSLRGLVIDGQVTGSDGINVVQASAVHIQNCVVRNFEHATAGVGIGIAGLPGTRLQVFVSDTIILNNGSQAGTGAIYVNPFASVTVVLDRVRLENNVEGLVVDGNSSFQGAGSHVTVRDSVVSGNAGHGIWSTRPVGGGVPTIVVVERTAAVHNAAAGVLADGGGIVLLSNSTVEYNGTGASVVNGGRLLTYGNNLIDNNVGEDLSPAAIARTVR